MSPSQRTETNRLAQFFFRQVRSKSAREGGYDVSLFRRLSDAHPEAVVELAYQYRMNEDIMLLSNRLIYSDRLRCGSQEVATRSLRLPNTGPLSTLHTVSSCPKVDCWMERRCWVKGILFLYRLSTSQFPESCKAIFVDTDAVPAQESPVGTLVQNEVEASLICQV